MLITPLPEAALPEAGALPAAGGKEGVSYFQKPVVRFFRLGEPMGTHGA